MIYRIDESYFNYAFENNLNIIAESNIGCSFLIQADLCPVDYLESYDDTQLEEIFIYEPFVVPTEEVEEDYEELE